MKWIYYLSIIIVLVACVSPGGVRRVKKQLIHQQKEDAYLGLIQHVLKKSSSKLQYFSIDNKEVPTIRLINKDDSGIVNWGKEIVAIQTCFKQKKILYTSICVLDRNGKDVSCYDEESLTQFEIQNRFVNSFISKLNVNNRPALNPYIDFSMINSNNLDDLLEYIGNVETVKIKDFGYFVDDYNYLLDDLNPVIESTFSVEINQHFEVFLVVSNRGKELKITHVNLSSD